MAFFRHLNVQKCSKHGVVCTFWFPNVLPKFFRHGPKVLRRCGLYILLPKVRHNGVHFFDISTSKSGRRMVWLVHFGFQVCFAPQRLRNFSTSQRPKVLQKCSDAGGVCTFWLPNVLRAKMACNFSTSQRPKVLQAWCGLYILTSKCASRHHCVQFFDISTSKSAPSMVWFVHFDFQRCFAPPRRAIFRHLNVQKCSDSDVACTFWPPNVLRATTACNFSTSQRPKVLRAWCGLCILTSKCASRHKGVQFFDITSQRPKMLRLWCGLYILTSKCASRHNGAQIFTSHLATWLRTRCFSEPTFRPSGATNHWKNTVFHDFARTCIFFLLTLSLPWSSLFCSSLLWLFPPLLFHLSILSEVWLLNFLRLSNLARLPHPSSFHLAKLKCWILAPYCREQSRPGIRRQQDLLSPETGPACPAPPKMSCTYPASPWPAQRKLIGQRNPKGPTQVPRHYKCWPNVAHVQSK